MDKLRDEILQAEDHRSGLLRWKLGLIGTIGAAGLGFAGSVRLTHADLVLCTLPPVALYVDFLALHLTLRILVIGAFLRGPEAPTDAETRAYEALAQRARNLPRGGSAFDLEDWALVYGTYALSIAVFGYGIYKLAATDPGLFGVPFVVSGAVGAAGAVFAGRLYKARCRAVDDLVEADEPGAA